MTQIVERVIVLVRRHGEDTYAIVSCQKSPNVGSPYAMQLAIDRALTRWFRTEEGRQARKNSSADFNIGDLSHELGDEELLRTLESEGVHDLQVDIHTSTQHEVDWSYDTVLGTCLDDDK